MRVKAAWFKSTRSNSNGTGGCVEVKAGPHILVRDSKQNGDLMQVRLSFTPGEWQAFIDGVKAGEFDL